MRRARDGSCSFSFDNCRSRGLATRDSNLALLTARAQFESPLTTAPYSKQVSCRFAEGLEDLHMKRCDVLWLVEHVAREMDVACAVKASVEERYGVEVVIRQFYQDPPELMRSFDPRVVVVPFFYHTKYLAVDEYVQQWPHAKYLNLQWEQATYGAQANLKRASDAFARERVVHAAWSRETARAMLQSGVHPDNVFLSGQPACQLYRSPYREHFASRDAMAQQYGLDAAKRWIFIPENYKWAFFDDAKLGRIAERGAELDEIKRVRAFCRESLEALLTWGNRAAAADDIEIVFRPRPATQSEDMQAFFDERVGSTSPGFRIVKGGTVREWILASDVTISSYSTSLIEAAVAGKPAYIAEPRAIPASLRCDWYDLVPRVHEEAEFIAVCRGAGVTESDALHDWANDELLGAGDPIENLAACIGSLVAAKRRGELACSASRGLARRAQGGVESAARTVWRRMKGTHRAGSSSLGPERPPRDYFNAKTHENDLFSDDEADAWANAWRDTLAAPVPVVSVIICTYNRAVLLERCLDSLKEQSADSDEFEIIVVDNNSTDATGSLVRRHVERGPQRVRYVLEEMQGLAFSRNCGYRMARGQYLAYLDDDTVVDEPYIANLLRVVREHSPDVLGGPIYPVYVAPKPRWFKDHYEIKKYTEESGFSSTCRVTGANFIIRRSVLESVGLFDVHYNQMTRNKIGLGDEAKVLDTYRLNTEDDDQKVYYALECYLRHQIPAFKMRRTYVLRRAFHGGRMTMQLAALRNEDHLRGLVRSLARELRDALRIYRWDGSRQGFAEADGVRMFITMANLAGKAVEGVIQKFNSERRILSA